jgi:MYXO-CTERM domain-containing protein
MRLGMFQGLTHVFNGACIEVSHQSPNFTHMKGTAVTRRLTIAAFAALLFASVPVAHADVVFSNLASGSPSYSTGLGNFIGNGQDNSGSNYAQGATFTPGTTATFTSLEIALSNYFQTNSDQLQVSLTKDSSGAPGSALASFKVAAGALGLLGNPNPLLSFTAPSGITLMAGTPYWVTVADISGGSDSNVWNWNSTGDTSNTALSQDGGSTWFSPSGLPPGAYEVDGTSTSVVPEPSTMSAALASAALGLLAGYRRRQRRTRRPAAKRPMTEPLEERVVLSTTFTWTQATSSSVGGGTMLQYPNGNVMMQGGGISQFWNMLAPDASGNYANNSSAGVSTMTTPRLYIASQVLPTGNVFVLGGEYSGTAGKQTETNTGEMYSSGNWSAIAPYPQTHFGDDESMLLSSGLILVGTGSTQGLPYTSTALTYLYNPTSSAITAMVNGASQSIAPGAYSTGIPNVFNTTNVEEGWVKLANGNVLSYDEWSSVYYHPGSTGYAEMFNPSTGTWQDVSPATGAANGSIPALSAVSDVKGNFWMEEGPPLLLPSGNVFFISGGTSSTALYNPSTNTWSAGPSLPFPYTADDAPAAALPNGDVIFTADSALSKGAFGGPTAMFDYSPGAGTITQLTGSNAPNDPGLGNPNVGSYVDRMLMLPTGQLMFTDAQDGATWVGTPNGAPQPQWRPVVTGFSGSSGVYTLTGLRLNGMNAGASYGDDAQMDENYPIVRFTSTAGGNVYYATTSNWSLPGAVATGSTSETVTVTLPSGMPAGNYSMVVSGAGINSFPVAFHLASPAGVVLAPPPGSSADLLPSGQSLLQSSITTITPSAPAIGSSQSNGLTTIDVFTPTGSSPIAMTDAVDSVFAGNDLAWLKSAAARPKARLSAGSLLDLAM